MVMRAVNSGTAKGSLRAARPSRALAVVTLARGPIVTKRGVAFQKGREPIPEPPKEPAASPLETGAIVLGLVSNPLVLYSSYTLKTTGSGLPPGPGGLYGAAEGIAYLVVLGIVGWSAYMKAKTGSGLPAGPSGLLGAVEGFSYLSVLAAAIVFALTFADKGALPGITG